MGIGIREGGDGHREGRNQGEGNMGKWKEGNLRDEERGPTEEKRKRVRGRGEREN